MSIVEKANNYIANLAPHIKKREAAKIIVELISELEKQRENFSMAKNVLMTSNDLLAESFSPSYDFEARASGNIYAVIFWLARMEKNND